MKTKILILVLSLACACNPDESVSIKKTKVQPVTKPASKLVLYVDDSFSMKGYLPPGQTELPNLIAYQFSAVASLMFDETEVKAFGNSVSESLKFPDLQRAILHQPRSKMAFDQGSSHIVGVLKQIQSSEDFAVVLTDNAQDLKSDVKNTDGCNLFYDIGCFARELARIAHQNRTIWLIGIKPRFTGIIYPVSHSNEFPVKDNRRPIFFWVIAKDPTQANQFISEFMGVLAKQTTWARNNFFALQVSPHVPLMEMRPKQTRYPGGQFETSGFSSRHRFRCYNDEKITIDFEKREQPVPENINYWAITVPRSLRLKTSLQNKPNLKFKDNAEQIEIDCGLEQDLKIYADDLHLQQNNKALDWEEWSTNTEDATTVDRSYSFQQLLETYFRSLEKYQPNLGNSNVPTPSRVVFSLSLEGK